MRECGSKIGREKEIRTRLHSLVRGIAYSQGKDWICRFELLEPAVRGGAQTFSLQGFSARDDDTLGSCQFPKGIKFRSTISLIRAMKTTVESLALPKRASQKSVRNFSIWLSGFSFPSPNFRSFSIQQETFSSLRARHTE